MLLDLSKPLIFEIVPTENVDNTLQMLLLSLFRYSQQVSAFVLHHLRLEKVTAAIFFRFSPTVGHSIYPYQLLFSIDVYYVYVLFCFSGVFVRVKEHCLHAECLKCAQCNRNLKNIGEYFTITSSQLELCSLCVLIDAYSISMLSVRLACSLKVA